jgi:Replication-relaxation
MRSSRESGRAPRVSAERLAELAWHVTERDREIALCLYEQQLLATDQLTLLFFSSTRRAQDRLLFLYRQRVLDRFYPPSRFGAGKPQAHWLLDEAGAQLVAATLGVERKRLGWQRRDDWGSHRQLAHRLEVNRFVTDLIAATLTGQALAVMEWSGPRAAAERLEKRVRPDARLLLRTAAGALIECLVELDRATEPGERLTEKFTRYRVAERKLRYHDHEPRSILFVVPGDRRLETLRRLPVPGSDDGSPLGRWPILATTLSALRRDGPVARVWQPINPRGEPPRALSELPARSDIRAADLRLALGRRWRHDQSDFWERLSPLGTTDRDLRSSAGDGSMNDREHDDEEEPWP